TRGFVADRVHHISRFQRQQPRLLDLDSRSGDVRANRSLRRDGLAECDTRTYSLAHRFERPLRQSDQSHAVMNPPWSKSSLRDLEASSFAEQNIRNGNAHVFEQHLAVTVRSVIVAEHGEHSLDLDARRIHRHEY